MQLRKNFSNHLGDSIDDILDILIGYDVRRSDNDVVSTGTIDGTCAWVDCDVVWEGGLQNFLSDVEFGVEGLFRRFVFDKFQPPEKTASTNVMSPTLGWSTRARFKSSPNSAPCLETFSINSLSRMIRWTSLPPSHEYSLDCDCFLCTDVRIENCGRGVASPEPALPIQPAAAVPVAPAFSEVKRNPPRRAKEKALVGIRNCSGKKSKFLRALWDLNEHSPLQAYRKFSRRSRNSPKLC